MLNTSIKFLVSCALLTSVAASAQEVREHEVKAPDAVERSKGETQEVLTGKKDSAGSKDLGESARRTLGHGRDLVTSGSETISAATAAARAALTKHAGPTVESLLGMARLQGFPEGILSKLTPAISTMAQESPSNEAEVAKVVSMKLSADGSIKAKQRKAIAAFIDVAVREHSNTLQLKSQNVIAKIQEYSGSQALDVYAELLERAARKIAAGQTDALSAIHESEVDLILERKYNNDQTKRSLAEEDATKLDKENCVKG